MNIICSLVITKEYMESTQRGKAHLTATGWKNKKCLQFRSDYFLLPKFLKETLLLMFIFLAGSSQAHGQTDQFTTSPLDHPVICIPHLYYLHLQIGSKLVFFVVLFPYIWCKHLKENKQRKSLVKLIIRTSRTYAFHVNTEKHM